jgi:signal recognition particle subunit SEC65
MSTLLILGSKPNPVIPEVCAYADVACVNGSGFSAAANELGRPAFTVMSANMTSGTEYGPQAFQAISGLETKKLYYLARSSAHDRKRSLRRRIKNYRSLKRMKPERLRQALDQVGYHYEEFIVYPREDCFSLVSEMCGQDPEVCACLSKKQPSTGIYALVLGITSGLYDNFILSGFNQERGHAYTEEVTEGSSKAQSRHVETDTAVLRALSRIYGDTLVTTEVELSNQTGLPLLETRHD